MAAEAYNWGYNLTKREKYFFVWGTHLLLRKQVLPSNSQLVDNSLLKVTIHNSSSYCL